MERGSIAAATLTAAGLAAGAWLYASTWPGSRLFGRTLIAGDDPNETALTFDDGPNDAATPELLDVLARHGVRATFFVIGNCVRQQPEIARQVLAEGHLLGNHTMHHPRLSMQPAARVRQELADCNAAIEDVTGAAIEFFRPPFGARRPMVLRAARELGLTPVMWNVTGYDWRPIGAEGILANLARGIARNRRRGRASNLLLHDGGHSAMGMPRLDTVRAVDRLLTPLPTTHRTPPMRFVTLNAWTRPAS
jgi:peptidoglycan-N-acetylglucosamine deacetylase